jgi:hypothetical protein
MLRKFGNIPNEINNKKPKKIIRYNKIIINKFYLNIKDSKTGLIILILKIIIGIDVKFSLETIINFSII